MALSKQEFKQFIRDFNFREMFNEMGWDRDNTTQSVRIDDHVFNLTSAGAKSGFIVFVCGAGADGQIPDYATRKKVETAVRRLYPEHLIIFHDSANTEQLWQFVARQSGKPTRVTETRWNKDQEPELLFQRASGVFFELDEEDNITIVDVTQRIAANFDQNNERVTKRFYERFTKEHKTFSGFVTGIDDHIDKWNKSNPKAQKENQNKQWYVSLMLNRLMFCYFIQKKGFLDKNKNYLRDKLRECREQKGKNKYYSFYRDFLMALFHEGLGTPDHSTELKAEIGRIPYLNGGLFDEHELEKQFDNIEIDDDAFEKIFEFFDQYEWHLDTRHTASGKDINPDVIGYIFEKYINERAAMGAYYTKEDITDYISKNCVLPFLFDEAKRNYSSAFKADGEIWALLRASGDKYIYDAVKKGVELELPENIAVGLDTTKPDLLERRKDWNKKAPDEYALPTEIWREVIDRRKQYAEAKAKIDSGAIVGINDFITYNLNIRQFAQDVVENTGDPKLLEHFYKALSSVTILDPTCGSGAFLFAAMNILEPLYQACIQRMRNFIEDEDRANFDDKRTFGHKFSFFRDVLEDIQNPAHPNLQYFVYKSIILRNLYGVDIMKEAVEVAKLRLFLKLVATVDADYTKPNLGLEPLPDIDFNIRAGNTLIGYVSQKQIDELAALLITADDKKKLLEECDIVARAFKRYKEIQLSQETDFDEFKNAKDDLNARLKKLNESLDRTHFKQFYGERGDYGQWRETHQPFHWFAEFYEIVHDNGGFDVIIGNPPYVEYSKVGYSLKNYRTLSCGNLYAYVTERSEKIMNQTGKLGMIVQLPIVCTDRMIPLQQLLLSSFSLNYFSTFDDRPGKLFDGLEHIRATIFISSKSGEGIFTTRYLRWNTEFRPFLFKVIPYHRNPFQVDGSILKIGAFEQETIFDKLFSKKPLSFHLAGDETVYFHNAPQYWIRGTDFVPYFWNERDGQKASVQIKPIRVTSKAEQTVVNAAVNSSLFYLWFIAWSDCRHLNMREIERFPISLNTVSNETRKTLTPMVRELMDDYQANKRRKTTSYKATGRVEYDEYFPRFSKPIIDEIDKVLAKYYGFTEEELDFIINYDIKYRMGAELDGDAD